MSTGGRRCTSPHREVDPAAIERLLDAGAVIHAVTEKGMPAIYWAATAASGDPAAAIRLLRARGADPRRETIQTYFGLVFHLGEFR